MTTPDVAWVRRSRRRWALVRYPLGSLNHYDYIYFGDLILPSDTTTYEVHGDTHITDLPGDLTLDEAKEIAKLLILAEST